MNQAKPNLRGQIPEIDGLRGIAILLVMVYHFWPITGSWGQLQGVIHQTWIGVDLFFVTSGFLITGILLDNLGGPGYFQNFYARRFLRIFPLYYLVLGVLTIMPYCGPTSVILAQRMIILPVPRIWYFLFLGNLREVLMFPKIVFNIIWSLAIEEQYYTTFPWLVWLTRGRVARLLVCVLLAAPLFRWVTLLRWPETWAIQYLSTPARMDTIAVGCILAVWLRRDAPWPTRRQVSGLALGSLAALAFGAVILWTVLYRGSRAAAFLRFGPLRYAGKLCYGLYLLHLMVAVVTLPQLRMGLSDASPLLMLLKFAVSFVLAALSWRYFEEPILSLKSRFSYVVRSA